MNVPPKLDEVIPRLRGVMHAYAFWFAAVAAGVLVALAPTDREVIRWVRTVHSIIAFRAACRMRESRSVPAAAG